MKSSFFAVLAACSVAFVSPSLSAQTTAPAAGGAVEPAAVPVDKHARPILAALHLNDAAKEARVTEAVVNYYQALRAWHTDNDDKIKPLWAEFNGARSKKDAAAANAALAKIADAYAGFKPQHDKFLADLGAVLTPEQIESVKDVMTVNKVKVTYGVYLQIFPQLTDAQKTVVLDKLKAAREAAIDCESMTEKSAFFKQYKIEIEDVYLTSQGLDPQQARKDFAAKQKAAKAAQVGGSKDKDTKD